MKPMIHFKTVFLVSAPVLLGSCEVLTTPGVIEGGAALASAGADAVGHREYSAALKSAGTFEPAEVGATAYDAEVKLHGAGYGSKEKYGEYVADTLRWMAPRSQRIFLLDDGPVEASADGSPSVPFRVSCQLTSLTVEQKSGSAVDLTKEDQFSLAGSDSPVTITAEVTLTLDEYVPSLRRFRTIRASQGAFAVKSKRVAIDYSSDTWSGGGEFGDEPGDRDDLNVIKIATHRALESLIRTIDGDAPVARENG